MAPDSFTMCHTGAKRIVRLLRAYDRAFSVRKAPYLISYVTYVSATVLVRMVAQDLPGSEAQEYLRTCVAVLEENQATNWGVRSALEILVNLMKRLGVEEGGGLVLSDNARGSSQPIGVEPWSSSSLIVHNQQRKGSTEAPHALLTAKGDRNFIEPDFDIDMVFQDFAGEFDGGVETTTVDMTPNFGLPPMAYSLDSGLAGSSTQPQMLLATASGDSGDFYAAIALDQDVSGSQVSGGTFF
ncbi:hypothetical protein MMC13_002640 [Lambiella insularis]|nr:hypothetical protein [Lambiella insularis]